MSKFHGSLCVSFSWTAAGLCISLLLFYSYESFSHQHLLTAFHRRLSDHKSPRVSRTLLSIMADLNNAVVWMSSTRPLISKSSSPCTNPLVTIPSAPIAIGITVTFMFHSYISSLARYRYFSLFSTSFRFTRWSAGKAKSSIRQVLFFFAENYEVWSSGWNKTIRLYLKISKNCMNLIFQGGFWVVHIPFIHMVKFKLLAQFSVDHLAHLIMSSLILS